MSDKSNLSQLDAAALIRPTYVGAAQYAAGSPVPLEEVIADVELCARLRAPGHGAVSVPRWDLDVLELAEAAARKSLLASKRHPQEIGAVFLVSNNLDAQNNLDAAWLGGLSKKLGLSKAAHYQIGMAGCAGFHWAAKLAAGLIGSALCDHILILSFDKADGNLRRLYAEETDFPYVTGDAGAACIFSASEHALAYRLLGKVGNTWDGEQALRVCMEDEIRCIDELIQQTYASASMAAQDVDLLITNNYSFTVSRLYCQLADLSFTKAFTKTIPTHAHCFASDSIINLHHVQHAVNLQVGQRLMLLSAGPFQWGACVLEKTS